MFEEYLQDSYEFLSIAEAMSQERKDREAKRYYRASIFYAAGSIEAFVNYIADSFEKVRSISSRSISEYEIKFLNDKTFTFSVNKGLSTKPEFHRLDEKIRLLMKKFVRDFDFNSLTWIKFMEFKCFRDSLVHPRQIDGETSVIDYRKKVRAGLKAIIEVMNFVSCGIFHKPLRRQLLDLIPE